MARSDDYIDFKAYIGYLRKVTGAPADPDALKKAILAKSEEPTEMQVALLILKRITVAAAAVLVIFFFSALCGYLADRDVCNEEDLWADARVDGTGRTPVTRLYEAYGHSSEIREKFL